MHVLPIKSARYPGNVKSLTKIIVEYNLVFHYHTFASYISYNVHILQCLKSLFKIEIRKRERKKDRERRRGEGGEEEWKERGKGKGEE